MWVGAHSAVQHVACRRLDCAAHKLALDCQCSQAGCLTVCAALRTAGGLTISFDEECHWPCRGGAC